MTNPVNVRLQEKKLVTSSNPVWVPENQLVNCSVWRVDILKDEVLGSLSARVVWVEPTAGGAVSLYRDDKFIGGVPMKALNGYKSLEAFQKAAWDALMECLSDAGMRFIAKIAEMSPQYPIAKS